jgi:hypothetical protein
MRPPWRGLHDAHVHPELSQARRGLAHAAALGAFVHRAQLRQRVRVFVRRQQRACVGHQQAERMTAAREQARSGAQHVVIDQAIEVGDEHDGLRYARVPSG